MPHEFKVYSLFNLEFFIWNFEQVFASWQMTWVLGDIYYFKVNNENTRIMCEICPHEFKVYSLFNLVFFIWNFEQVFASWQMTWVLVDICYFKVNNGNTRIMWEIFPKLTKTSKQCRIKISINQVEN